MRAAGAQRRRPPCLTVFTSGARGRQQYLVPNLGTARPASARPAESAGRVGSGAAQGGPRPRCGPAGVLPMQIHVYIYMHIYRERQTYIFIYFFY